MSPSSAASGTIVGDSRPSEAGDARSVWFSAARCSPSARAAGVDPAGGTNDMEPDMVVDGGGGGGHADRRQGGGPGGKKGPRRGGERAAEGWAADAVQGGRDVERWRRRCRERDAGERRGGSGRWPLRVTGKRRPAALRSPSRARLPSALRTRAAGPRFGPPALARPPTINTSTGARPGHPARARALCLSRAGSFVVVREGRCAGAQSGVLLVRLCTCSAEKLAWQGFEPGAAALEPGVRSAGFR